MAELITHKCRNYEICYGTLPIFNKFENPQLCNDCNVMFKNSPSIQTTNGQCAVCCVDGECFLQPKCKHLLCKICFQKCKFGLPDITEEPRFPYLKIEDQYFNEMDDDGNEQILWNLFGEYPLIEEWKKKCEKHDTVCSARNNLKKSTKCPICSI